jgi:TPR repeat protein
LEPSSRSQWDWNEAGMQSARALQLWERSAAMGFAEAGVEVGDHYLGANDTARALEAYTAASTHSAEGLWAIAQVHHYGLGGVPRDYPRAADLYQKAIAFDPTSTLPSAVSLAALYVSWGAEALAADLGLDHSPFGPTRHADVAALIALGFALLVAAIAAMHHIDELIRRTRRNAAGTRRQQQHQHQQ